MLQLHEFHVCIPFDGPKSECRKKKLCYLESSAMPALLICVMGSFTELVEKSSSKRLPVVHDGVSHHLHPPHHLVTGLDHPIASTIPSCRVYHRHSHRSVQRPGLFVACKNPKLLPGFNKQRGLQPVDCRPKKIENQPNRRGHAPSNNCEDVN